MRLAGFIRENIEQVLDQWEKFAATIPPARHLDKDGRRDHASQMLIVVANDLDQSQTDRERADKSKGLGAQHAEETAAEVHGSAREAAGFSINETISEFRALRSSVIALWFANTPTLRASELEDLNRFNEAIDQAVTESIARYATEKAR